MKRLQPSDQRYQKILFNGRGLQAKLRAYDEVIPLINHIIYHSTTSDELQIVIDAGESCSITSNPLDFDDDPILPEFSHFSGISSQTAVNGQGTVTWHIEDANGVRRPISTKAYLVSQAGICLFSPQVYFQENKESPNNPHLRLDSAGTSLTLECGTTYISQSNPLLIYLSC